MFNQSFLILLNQKEDYIKLKVEVANTPLEMSIDNILVKINQDKNKIYRLNQIL